MLKFLVFLILLFTCWPLALLALILYPFVWLVLLPFRLVGIVVGGIFHLVEAIFLLPIRILRGPRHHYYRGINPRLTYGRPNYY